MRSLFFLLFVCAAQGAELVGTDLLEGDFAAALRHATGKDVADFAGTLPSRRAFAEGRAAAAILMVRPGEASPVPGAREFRLASAVVVVATHGSNRMEQITFEQLVNAFGKDARAPARKAFPAAGHTFAVRSPKRAPAAGGMQGPLFLFWGVALITTGAATPTAARGMQNKRKESARLQLSLAGRARPTTFALPRRPPSSEQAGGRHDASRERSPRSLPQLR